MDCEPDTPLVPAQPPLALQDAALDADQLRVDVLPFATVLGLPLKLMVGAACLTDTVADCTAVPPAPVQDSV